MALITLTAQKWSPVLQSTVLQNLIYTALHVTLIRCSILQRCLFLELVSIFKLQINNVFCWNWQTLKFKIGGHFWIGNTFQIRIGKHSTSKSVINFLLHYLSISNLMNTKLPIDVPLFVFVDINFHFQMKPTLR